MYENFITSDNLGKSAEMTIFMNSCKKMLFMERFDWSEAVSELESIAAKMEDPSVGIDEIDKLVKRSGELVEQCRQYLRTVRENIEKQD